MRAYTRPAVIAGGEINGLGVARSLARAGVPTVLLDTDPGRATMRTRYGRKHRVASLEGEPFLAELLRLRAALPADPVLFLTQEKSVATVAAHLDRIAGAYRLSMPSAEIMRMLMDKASFQDAAERLGAPIARAVTLRADADIAALASLRFPCVMKPVVKSAEYDRRFKKAYRIEEAAAAEALYREVGQCAVMIVQEWIEGGDDAIYFCLQFRSRDGRAVASFCGRKLRSWPPRIGGTASCLGAPEATAELAALTDGFFAATGFFGLGSMEYKKDTRTGRFMMIEPTVGRTDFQEEVATLNGVNVPLAAYCWESGVALPPAAAPGRPAGWSVANIDRWSRELQPDNAGGFPAGVRNFDAVRRWDDPVPWLCERAAAVTDWLAARRRGRLAPAKP